VDDEERVVGVEEEEEKAGAEEEEGYTMEGSPRYTMGEHAEEVLCGVVEAGADTRPRFCSTCTVFH
jgi:hypothetical protein